MELEKRAEGVLEERVRPMLSGHGGGVRLAGCEEGLVSVELLGERLPAAPHSAQSSHF